MMKSVCLLLVLMAMCQGRSEKCRVLVLEGGGDRGAYHAGAFDQMVKMMPPQEVAYDIITGISVGALNGLALSFFEKGDEARARDFLNSIWDNITADQVYKLWPWYVFSPTQKRGLLDTSPLRDYLTNMANAHPVVRNFTVGTSNILKHRYERFSNEDVPSVEDKVSMLMSSSAIPALFPFQTWRGQKYVDGGALKNFDVVAGVRHCTSMGYAQKDIIIDSILCYGKKFNYDTTKMTNTIQAAAATVDLEMNRFFLQDLHDAKEEFPDVHYRYIVTPNFYLELDLFILFNKEQMKLMYESGQKDVQTIINQFGDNGNFQHTLETMPRSTR